MDTRDYLIVVTYTLLLGFALATVWTKWFMHLLIKWYDLIFQKTMATIEEMDGDLDAHFNSAIKEDPDN